MTHITYIRMHVGFAYLAVVIDLYFRRVVGWSTQSHQTTDVVLQALLMAVWRRTYKTRTEARQDVFDYTEMFYNLMHKHVRNGMLSPVEFERQQKIETEGAYKTWGSSDNGSEFVSRDMDF